VAGLAIVLGGGEGIVWRPAPIPGNAGLGLPVWSVTDVLRLREAWWTGDGAIAIAGFWSDGMVGHSCPLQDRQPDGVDHCRVGEYGFTELNEPAMIIAPGGQVTHQAEGPLLQPWLIGQAAGSVLYGPGMVGPRPPVPVVVIGRFNDPQAAICPAETRDGCNDGFVVLAVAWVNGQDRLPNIADRAVLEDAPLEPDLEALDRIVADVMRPSERLLSAGVADGGSGGLFDRRIRHRLAGPTWFLTVLEPGGGIRSVGVDQASGQVVWPPP
jgi:hypothetical protein